MVDHRYHQFVRVDAESSSETHHRIDARLQAAFETRDLRRVDVRLSAESVQGQTASLTEFTKASRKRHAKSPLERLPVRRRLRRVYTETAALGASEYRSRLTGTFPHEIASLLPGGHSARDSENPRLLRSRRKLSSGFLGAVAQVNCPAC